MTIATFDSLTRRLAAASISGYQKHISPRKGFSCAYRVLYGGESCSQYVKRAIIEQGLIEAIAGTRQRFQACKAANQILKSQRHALDFSQQQEEEQRRRRQNESDRCNNTIDCANFACEPIDCLGVDFTDCSGCGSGTDCGGMHCGNGIDCSSIDCCSAPDCGSCCG